MTTTLRRVAIYARVSTIDQTADNQLLELRRYVAARGWSAVEYVDHGAHSASGGGCVGRLQINGGAATTRRCSAVQP